MSGFDPSDDEAVRARLEARLAELRALSADSVDSRDVVELDQSRVGRLSRMDALQMQAMAQATEQRREMEIARIDAALKRLAAGDYGYCLSCGEEIALARLDLDPAIPTCVDCAQA